MIGIYFSGTGNTKYCVEQFVNHIDAAANCYAIEDDEAVIQIKKHEDIVFGYSVQYSNIPKFVKDFIQKHAELWKGKRIFVIATMGMFSGDGSGILARELKKYGADILGGLHVKMPDSIADEKLLKHSLEENKRTVALAAEKLKKAAAAFQNGKIPQEGIGFLSHLAGLFGQRLYFSQKTKQYSNKLKIDQNTCIGCGTCADLCPMDNIKKEGSLFMPLDRCTMCYRCISRCPAQAITLLGKKVVDQSYIEKFL